MACRWSKQAADLGDGLRGRLEMAVDVLRLPVPRIGHGHQQSGAPTYQADEDAALGCFMIVPVRLLSNFAWA
jgi:hypothetical protein